MEGRRWIVVVDYRYSGLKMYPFYSFDQAKNCYEFNADPAQKDVVISAALFDMAYTDELPKRIKTKEWRDEK